MYVLKFGGTSVADSSAIQQVADILQQDQYKGAAVIVSALGGVTDTLLSLANKASSGDESYVSDLSDLISRHTNTITELLAEKSSGEVVNTVQESFGELKNLLHGIYLIREASPRTLDHVLSFGERSSAYIISHYLSENGKPAVYTDARSLLKTSSEFGKARLQEKSSFENITAYCEKHPSAFKIVTGFIGSDEEGVTTTLGRGGSDYSAAIFAAAVEAEALEIWTDVDGVLTSNPNLVLNAYTIPSLSYREAAELSHFGAKVIYPPTIQPALAKSIPIRIRNTFNPAFEGTLIAADPSREENATRITGLSSVSNVALLTIEGTGLMGVPGTSARLFNALGASSINVTMISQASSEHSICFTVSADQAEKAKRVCEDEFRSELDKHWIDKIRIENDLSLVAIVGEGMKSVPGVSGKLFRALGKNGINVVAIAQGSSERNITFAISTKDEAKALNLLHDGFFLSPFKKIHVFLMGVGLIGSTLLTQIEQQYQLLREEKKLDIRVAGIANSRKMLFNAEGISLSNWKEDLESLGENSGFTNFLEKTCSLNLANSIFVDCTANPEVKNYYNQFLAANISISTANKVAASSSFSEYRQLHKTALDNNVEFLFETNVGAGLPVLSTIRNQVESGDRVQKIYAVVSGSLSWIFNNYSPDKKFSELVQEARKLGFTEPDPREDLSGQDIKRKIIILSRVAGFTIEPDEVEVEQILPQACTEAKSVDAFFTALDNENEYFEKLVLDAQQQNKKLRYIASYVNGKAAINLEMVDQSSPFYNLASTDNMVVIYTDRYQERPLTVQGPGAGADVTAAGVFAEIIQHGQFSE